MVKMKPKIKAKYIRKGVRRFWATLFALIIALAVSIQLGRQAFPMLDDYKSEISTYLGEKLNLDISIGGVSATWKGLRPKIELKNLSVKGSDGTTAFAVKNAVAELSIIDSFAQSKLAWRRLEFSGFDASLQQNDSGRWSVRGLEFKQKDNQEFFIKGPLDIFLIGRYVEINDANLTLHFRTSHHTQINVPTIRLENDKDFHRISAYVGVDDDDQALSFIVEGQGDPRDPATFRSNGHVSLNQFPVEKVLAAIGGDLWKEVDKEQWRDGHRLNLNAWFRGNSTSGLTVRGSASMDGLPLNLPVDVQLPTLVETQFVGKLKEKEGWELVLQSVRLNWPEFSAPELNIKVYGGIAKPNGFIVDKLQAEEWMNLAKKIELDRVVGEITKSDVARRELHGVIHELAPHGVIRNLDLKLTSAEEGYFQAKAIVEQGGTNAYVGVPAFEGIDAYVEFRALTGWADVNATNGLSVNLPDIFPEKFDYSSAKGRVGWTVDVKKRIAHVHSDVIEISNHDELGRGYLKLFLPFNSSIGEPEMTLSIGVEHSLTKYHKKYIPTLIPKHLYQWLEQSIGEGTVTNVGLIYDGSISSKPQIPPSIQLYGEAHNANLAFDSEWPELKNVSGILSLDNDDINVNIKKATLLGNSLSNTEIVLVKNPYDNGDALAIQGELNSNAKAAMALMKDSPIREAIGDTFDSWVVDGDVSATIKLFVPLDEEVKGLSQDVAVRFRDSNLHMNDLNLTIESINGHVTYSSETGLSSPGLVGKVWEEDFQATIDSPIVDVPVDVKASSTPVETLDDEFVGEIRDTKIYFQGRVDASNVRDWGELPELYFTEGKTDVTGILTIPTEGTKEYAVDVDVASNLSGIAVNLPSPFTKPSEVEKQLSINIKVFDTHEKYSFLYDETIRMAVIAEDTGESSLQIGFGEELGPMSLGYFDVHGHIPNMDIELWNEAIDQYLYFEALQAELLKYEVSDSSTPVRMDVTLGEVSLGDIVVSSVKATGLGTADQWEFDFESEMIKGNTVIYVGDIPTSMTLDYLRFPQEEVDSTVAIESSAKKRNIPEDRSLIPLPVSELAELDLKSAIALNFSTKEMTVGSEKYGEWAFKTRPTKQGVVVYDIIAKMRGIYIGNLNEGAEFVWVQEDGKNSSHFSGVVSAGDTGEVLREWGQEVIMESETVTLFVEAEWDGAPDQISMANFNSVVNLDITNGNFIRGAEAGENPILRLMGLFNFDTIARRLKLDFSDLAKKGFAFDSVNGQLAFKNGYMFLSEPMEVKSSSSKMQLAGTVDLLEEELDTELVVTLPVTGNLAVATALIVGLPAAVSVYLVGKLFSNQVDKVSSINYRVFGGWAEPKIKIKKVFDNSGAKKKAGEVKEKQEETGGEHTPLSMSFTF